MSKVHNINHMVTSCQELSNCGCMLFNSIYARVYMNSMQVFNLSHGHADSLKSQKALLSSLTLDGWFTP